MRRDKSLLMGSCQILLQTGAVLGKRLVQSMLIVI